MLMMTHPCWLSCFITRTFISQRRYMFIQPSYLKSLPQETRHARIHLGEILPRALAHEDGRRPAGDPGGGSATGVTGEQHCQDQEDIRSLQRVRPPGQLCPVQIRSLKASEISDIVTAQCLWFATCGSSNLPPVCLLPNHYSARSGTIVLASPLCSDVALVSIAVDFPRSRDSNQMDMMKKLASETGSTKTSPRAALR